MKCPTCGGHTKVLETRTRKEFFIVRTHECGNAHRFKTIQTLDRVWLRNKYWNDYALIGVSKGIDLKRQRFATRARIKEMLRKGEKWEVIKLTVGVSHDLIWKVKKELKELQNGKSS